MVQTGALVYSVEISEMSRWNFSVFKKKLFASLQSNYNLMIKVLSEMPISVSFWPEGHFEFYLEQNDNNLKDVVDDVSYVVDLSFDERLAK